MAEQGCFYHNYPVSKHDVICGKKCEKHPGNTAFRKIVTEFSQQYQSTSSRSLKKQIIEQVIGRVHQLGGRFIKENDERTTMVDVSQHYVYEKVSHALRSIRPKHSAATIQESRPTSGFNSLLEMQQRLFSSYQMDSMMSTTNDTDDPLMAFRGPYSPRGNNKSNP